MATDICVHTRFARFTLWWTDDPRMFRVLRSVATDDSCTSRLFLISGPNKICTRFGFLDLWLADHLDHDLSDVRKKREKTKISPPGH